MKKSNALIAIAAAMFFFSCKKETKSIDQNQISLGKNLTSSLSAQVTGSTTKVFIGGGNSYAGLIQGTASQSAYVMANVDGWYINDFALNGKPASYISDAYNRFTNKNAFYESDFYALTGTDPANNTTKDVTNINRFTTAGFNVAYATLNTNYSSARKYGLKTGNTNRPVLRMIAPWTIGGNFFDGSHTYHNATYNFDKTNTDLQNEIKNCQGSATDGPWELWTEGTTGEGRNSMRLRLNPLAAGGSATLVQYVKSINTNFTTMVMMAPDMGNGQQYLDYVKDCVRIHERADLGPSKPTIYVLSYYGPPATYDNCPILPETDASGNPAQTFAGAAYWLIKHLKGEPGYN